MGWLNANGIWIGRNRGGGISWQTYWTSLISATVENAAPTKVVITMGMANTSTVAVDWTVTGHTVTLLERDATNKIITLTLSVAVLVFEEDLFVTLKGTFTHAITNNVNDDGKTAAWYDNDLTTITKDINDLVSVWACKLGTTHDLLQPGAATLTPLWNAAGVLCNGLNSGNYMEASFALNQPTFIYAVFKQVTWTINDRIFDGKVKNAGALIQSTTTPNLLAYAGIITTESSLVPVDTWVIARILFSGANSKFIVNENAAITGNMGAGNMGGFTLGRQGSTAAMWGHVHSKEYIIRTDATSEAAIYAYLKRKYATIIDLE